MAQFLGLPIIILITAVSTFSSMNWGCIEVLSRGEGVSLPGCLALGEKRWCHLDCSRVFLSTTFPKPQSSLASFLFSRLRLPPSIHKQDVTLLPTDLHLNKHCKMKQCVSGKEHGFSSPPGQLILARLTQTVGSDKRFGRGALTLKAG